MRPLIVAVLAFVVLMMGAVGMALSPLHTTIRHASATASNAPLKIDCAMMGRFRKGYSWTLKVKPDGQAHLTVWQLGKKPRDFHLSAERMAELGRTVDQERFFDLQNSYGEEPFDGSQRTLTITQGKQTKAVTLYEFAGDVKYLSEIKRTLRVWNAVQATFVDPDAEDLRHYDPSLTEAR